MIVFKGKRPTDYNVFRQMIQGVNGGFCFFDEQTLWEQCKMKNLSGDWHRFPIFTYIQKLFTSENKRWKK